MVGDDKTRRSKTEGHFFFLQEKKCGGGPSKLYYFNSMNK
jgi:hypothetical protein